MTDGTLGETLYVWDDTENWPMATYKIGVVAYENLVIVRPPAPLGASKRNYKRGLDPEVGVAYAKLCQRAIETIREQAEEYASANGGTLDQKSVREVVGYD